MSSCHFKQQCFFTIPWVTCESSTMCAENVMLLLWEMSLLSTERDAWWMSSTDDPLRRFFFRWAASSLFLWFLLKLSHRIHLWREKRTITQKPRCPSQLAPDQKLPLHAFFCSAGYTAIVSHRFLSGVWVPAALRAPDHVVDAPPTLCHLNRGVLRDWEITKFLIPELIMQRLYGVAHPNP